MNKTGWIIYNGTLRGDKFLDFAQMLEQAATKIGSQAKIYKNNELLTYLASNQLEIQRKDSSIPDYVIFTDKDLYLARQLELLNIPVFNEAKAIEISDDKISTYQHLAKEQLPIPQTIVAPKVFGRNNEGSKYINFDTIVSKLGFPLIIKEAFGSFGEQVYLVHSYNQLQQKVNELYGKAFLFQEFIASSYGTDLRLQIVGNKVVAAMKRTSTNDFRSNVTSGATMERYTPTKLEEELAIKATKAIGADFAGVDLLIGPNKNPVICEVNSNAHIRNLLDCTGINTADHILDYVIRSIGKGRNHE